MTLSTVGLVRITIRAPRRRVDLSVPHLVPLAEILPEVVVRAGEADGEMAPGGWVLRRGDGARLASHVGLSAQGVSDGAVLYLVPGRVSWPEPRYDDLVEQIADGAREHSPMWTAATTRVVAAVAAVVALFTGVAGLWFGDAHHPAAASTTVALAATLVLLGSGAALARLRGDRLAGTVAGAGALSYASVAGALLVATRSQSAPMQLLAASMALLVTSVVAGLAIGCGLRIFVAGLTIGTGGAVAAVARSVLTAPQAAAILTVLVLAVVGATPWLAVRLGRLPVPLLSADPELLAREQRPAREAVLAAVARADGVLAGLLLGLSVLGAACTVLLGAAPGWAAGLLALLASLALLMRARLFPAVWARVPLLVAGGGGICLAGVQRLGIGAVAGTAVATGGVLVALGLLATAAARAEAAPSTGRLYLGRLADVVEVASLVALAPVACVVLDLYGWVGGLAG